MGESLRAAKLSPFDTLNCLLGMAMALHLTALEECRDQPSVVNASWVLTSDGQTVAQGSSDDYKGGGWMNDSIARELGQFQSQSGRRYLLDVNVLADGSSLGPGNPRLKVELDSQAYKGYVIWNGILFLATGVLVVVGITLLAVSTRKTRHRG